ncbi:ComF family protein [Cyanobium sp. FGCU-52]|nr:ComF family protein [Cyanobium sp. FGCU52]
MKPHQPEVPFLLSLGRLVLGGMLERPCPLCRQHQEAFDSGDSLCQKCRQRLQLPLEGLQGLHPLPWWAAGFYADGLRSLLLDLRRRPRTDTLDALIGAVRPPEAILRQGALLVPIPSWKRRGNPLPDLLCRRLRRRHGLRRADLLQHRHPVLGQHGLNRRLRFANLETAFQCRRPPLPGQGRRRPLLIVDDILTTGATACSAARALEEAGWQVAGMLCLARTRAGRRRP